MNVEAEMPATIVRVLVRPGLEVSAGEALVILESMKMEIPVEAPIAGVITAVHVEDGAVVSAGDLMVVLE